jgi:hypothetical protein
MDKEEWLRLNLYDYPWFLDPFVLIVPFVFMLFLCYLLFCSVNVSTLKIVPCPCAEISVNHTALDWAILPYPYAEIMDNHTVWAQPFFLVHIKKSGIIVRVWAHRFFLVHIGSFAIFRLTLISAYGQGRMGEPKTVWISLVSTYGIRDIHTVFGSPIRPCPCAEIKVNHTGLGSTFFLLHMQKSGIIALLSV